jgi:competence protein ComEA
VEDDSSRRTALIRAATQAYEAAHGNPLPEPARGLRWSIRPRVAVTVLACVVVLVAFAVLAHRAQPGAVAVDEPLAAVEPGTSVVSGSITLHVVGAVASPGVVEVPLGARAGDAIAAAGGALPEAELSSINLARTVQDGEQIRVAHAGEAGAAVSGAGSGLVSINEADAAALESLPGIGPVLAERIVKDRESNGPFASVDDLDRVSGVGAAVLERVRDHVTV